LKTVIKKFAGKFDVIIHKEFDDPKFTRDNRRGNNNRRGRRRKMLRYKCSDGGT